MKHVLLYGGTGQAKVVRPIIESQGGQVVAVVDDTPGLAPPFGDVPLLAGWEGLLAFLAKAGHRDLGFSVTIGNPHGRVRLRLHAALISLGLSPVTVIHPSAVVAPTALIGPGCQLMAGAIVNPDATVGGQCIINTKASLDHESILGDGSELAPGATVCGSVTMGINVWVGAGATVLPWVSIGDDSIIGAGATVIRNVPSGQTWCGIPAKEMVRSEL